VTAGRKLPAVPATAAVRPPTGPLTPLMMPLTLVELVTGPAWLTALVAAGTTVVTVDGPGGSGWPDWAAAGWPDAAAPWLPWVSARLAIVWLTAATALAAAGRFGLLLRVPVSGALLLGGMLVAAPVLWPPPWPGMMSWVTSRPADAAALMAAGTGVSFVPPLLDPAGGAGGTLAAVTLAAAPFAAGAAREEAVLAPDAWLGGPGWLTGPGWLGVCAELSPGPGMAPGTAPVAELIADPAADPTAETAWLAGRPAVRPPVVAGEEPAGDAETGFWAAAARPARSTAKSSAAANPPHAYRHTLRARSKARVRVADPSTGTKLPLDADNHAYLVSCRTKPGRLPDPHADLLPA